VSQKLLLVYIGVYNLSLVFLALELFIAQRFLLLARRQSRNQPSLLSAPIILPKLKHFVLVSCLDLTLCTWSKVSYVLDPIDVAA